MQYIVRAGGCPVVAALCQSTDWQLKLRALGSIPSNSPFLYFKLIPPDMLFTVGLSRCGVWERDRRKFSNMHGVH